MRVSCGCPIATASPTLLDRLKARGLKPIVTNIIIRVVYEGPDKSLGEFIVNTFSQEKDHQVTVFYDEQEQRQSARKAERKAERARRNAKLHGH